MTVRKDVIEIGYSGFRTVLSERNRLERMAPRTVLLDRNKNELF